jgi:hypothetical protein
MGIVGFTVGFTCFGIDMLLTKVFQFPSPSEGSYSYIYSSLVDTKQSKTFESFLRRKQRKFTIPRAFWSGAIAAVTIVAYNSDPPIFQQLTLSQSSKN